MKVGFFKVLGMIGMLGKELTAAAADGRITIHEAIHIMRKICEELGIELDETGIDL